MEKLGIIVLQETKCSKVEMEITRVKICQGSEAIVVDVKGPIDGIGILWNPIPSLTPLQLSSLSRLHSRS